MTPWAGTVSAQIPHIVENSHGVNEGILGISSTQWNNLMTILNKYQPSHNEKLSGKNGNIWLIDTGASRHMAGQRHFFFFSNITAIDPCYIRLSNGSQIISKSEGCVSFGSNMVLKNVLCVPNLKCNLLLVSQFLRSRMTCCIIFTDDSCVVRDLLRGWLLGNNS